MNNPSHVIVEGTKRKLIECREYWLCYELGEGQSCWASRGRFEEVSTLSKDQVLDIFHKRIKGMSVGVIADLYNIDHSYCSKILSRFRLKKIKVPKELIEQVEAMTTRRGLAGWKL